MRKIRVLHVLQSNTYSGAENVVCQIVEMFRVNPEYTMAYTSPDGKIKTVLEQKSIQYIPLQRLSVHDVRKAINEFSPDVIHTHDIAASVISTLAARNTPIVAHVHGNHLNMRKITLKSLLVMLMSKRWKKIIWVSKSAIDDYCFNQKVKSNSIVLPNIILKNSVTEKIQEAIVNENYDCIFLGRINSIKNPIRAIDILNGVKRSIPDIKAAFVGEGALFEDCKKHIAELGLENNIKMFGYLENPMGILSKSKLLLMTSVYEGTPMCALEAMALGLPIVSTPTDGIVDLIEQGRTGVYDSSDSKLIDAIVDLLGNTIKYKEFKERTIIRFESLMDVKKYTDTLDTVYKQSILT